MNIINYLKEKMRLSNTETLEVIENRKDYRTIIEKFKKLEFKKDILKREKERYEKEINSLETTVTELEKIIEDVEEELNQNKE